MTSTPHKKKIIIVVLALALVTLILGLGLGLGLDLKRCRDEVVPVTSCRSRCFEPFDSEVSGCRCDSGCVANGGCCHDYHDLCTAPAQTWRCSRVRCGETRLQESRCHCSDDCLSAGDCCSDYTHVCHGEKQWEEGDCDDLSTPSCPSGFRRQPLLLVSLDGLRAEYLQTWSALTPVLNKLKTCGTSAPYMQSAFPTKTFPNHYTIVTGLYPESNGLIDNSMYDPDMDASFSLSSPEKDNPDWYLGQPIWHTARYHGLKSGTFFWPGSDVKINGSFPNIYRPYNGKVPFEERVFTLLKWLQLPDDERPDFFTLYLEEPDKSGHNFGPVSGGLISALQGVDVVMSQLMNGLKQIGLHQCLNIIVVADHGMEETSCDRMEVLQDLVGDVQSFWVTEGTFGRIRNKNNEPLDSAGLVANMSCKSPEQKIKPYLKSDLPKRLHYANSRRIEDVTVLVEPKWLFERSPGSLRSCSGGAHGYDNDAESMHAMFLSHGPKFLSRTQVEPFSNIELYNLMCDVLQISPAVNNGTHGSMNHVLRTPHHYPQSPAESSPPAHCPLLSLHPEDTLGCSCPGLDVGAVNQRLNLTAAAVEASSSRHTPFGRPVMLQSDRSFCVLHHEGFISGFDLNAKTPLWSSFTVLRPMNPEPVPPVMADCLRADGRLTPAQSPRCDGTATNLKHGFLYPPSLNETADQRYDALLMSNVVSMFPQFQRVWDYFFGSLLVKYAAAFNGVNVVVGPAFDFNHDGRYDTKEQIQQLGGGANVSGPSHFFVVLTSCRDSEVDVTSCSGELQSVSFLLPHRENNTESCKSALPESEWVEDLVWFHQARLRDVEWITGLDFYQGSKRPITELLRLKSRPTAANHRPR